MDDEIFIQRILPREYTAEELNLMFGTDNSIFFIKNMTKEEFEKKFPNKKEQ